jgi:DNA-binding GntR family transcriptional regulator
MHAKKCDLPILRNITHFPMPKISTQNSKGGADETTKAPFLVIGEVRNAILDGIFKPGDRLLEGDLAERFQVSRSPVREALLALEKEGTVFMAPYKGAIVKPLSPEEVWDIAELRLALVGLAAKPAHRNLSPADFDLAYQLAKKANAAKGVREYVELSRRFWDVLFQKAQRPILWEMFTQLDDRMTRYFSLLPKLYPTPASRPRHQEVLIEIYRKGKIDEALRAFRKIYLEVVERVISYLNTGRPTANRGRARSGAEPRAQ